MMLPRRTQPASAKADALKERAQKKKPTLDEFLDKRDWSGALGLLQFERNSQNGEYDVETLVMWMAYSAFHLGDYKKAANVMIELCVFPGLLCASSLIVSAIFLQFLDELIMLPQAEPVWNLYKACCLFYLGGSPLLLTTIVVWSQIFSIVVFLGSSPSIRFCRVIQAGIRYCFEDGLRPHRYVE
jgi:hypothetical protein